MSIRIQFYMSGAWTDISTALIEPGVVVERHMQEYYWTFRHRTPYDIQAFSWGTPVLVTDNDDDGVIFRGFISQPDRSGATKEQGITYRCESFWYVAALSTMSYLGIPRVVYNARQDDPQHDPTRVRMTVGQILTDAASLVSAEISATATAYLGHSWAGLTIPNNLDMIPAKQVLDGYNLPQLLKALAKLAPDAYLQINRDTGLFTLRRRSSATVYNLDMQNLDNPTDLVPVSGVRIQPRFDTVVPRYKLKFPNRVEYSEAYIDAALTTGTPDYLVGIPQTLTKVDEFRFKASNTPVSDIIEIVPGSPYKASLVAGMITFKYHPANFYLRYIAETSQILYDTGYGGTGYTDYSIAKPIYERYIDDFPKLTRNFYLLGPDHSDATWLLSGDFALEYSNPDDWPSLVGKTVTITGRGASTISQIAIHTFVFTSGEQATIQGIVGAISTYNMVGIKLTAAITGAVRGDTLNIVVEDNTASVTALADSLWKAQRDVRWAGELPILDWHPELKIGDAVNLLNTNDIKMESMNENIIEIAFDLATQKTTITLAANPSSTLDDLLAILRQNLIPQKFTAAGGGINSGGGGKLQAHKHDSADNGGTELKPKRFEMNSGVAGGDNEWVWGTGANQIKISTVNILSVDYSVITLGDTTGNYLQLFAGANPRIRIHGGGKDLYLGVTDAAVLDLQLDGVGYMSTPASTRIMGAKVRATS